MDHEDEAKVPAMATPAGNKIDTLSIRKELDCRIFDGKDVDTWLKDYDEMAARLKWDDEAWTENFIPYLNPRIKDMMRKHVEEFGEENNRSARSYVFELRTAMKRFLCDTYSSVGNTEELRIAMGKMKMGSTPINEHFISFREALEKTNTARKHQRYDPIGPVEAGMMYIQTLPESVREKVQTQIAVTGSDTSIDEVQKEYHPTCWNPGSLEQQ
jgi:hypothetical protein